jgi:hypothetical protein
LHYICRLAPGGSFGGGSICGSMFVVCQFTASLHDPLPSRNGDPRTDDSFAERNSSSNRGQPHRCGKAYVCPPPSRSGDRRTDDSLRPTSLEATPVSNPSTVDALINNLIYKRYSYKDPPINGITQGSRKLHTTPFFQKQSSHNHSLILAVSTRPALCTLEKLSRGEVGVLPSIRIVL